MDTVKIGESIAEARNKRNFTQADLAEEVGVSVQAVSKWENGRNLPDIENLLRIAEVTNVPYSYMIDAGRDNEDDMPDNDRKEGGKGSVGSQMAR